MEMAAQYVNDLLQDELPKDSTFQKLAGVEAQFAEYRNNEQPKNCPRSSQAHHLLGLQEERGNTGTYSASIRKTSIGSFGWICVHMSTLMIP